MHAGQCVGSRTIASGARCDLVAALLAIDVGGRSGNARSPDFFWRFECVPSAYWQLKSWDRFTIPKPFGTLYFYASNPVSLDDLESDEAKNVVYNGLMQHRVEH